MVPGGGVVTGKGVLAGEAATVPVGATEGCTVDFDVDVGVAVGVASVSSHPATRAANARAITAIPDFKAVTLVDSLQLAIQLSPDRLPPYDNPCLISPDQKHEDIRL